MTGESSGTVRDETGFLAKALEVGGKLRQLDEVRLVHHFDADGISAGAIATVALEKAGVSVARTCWKKYTPENLAELVKTSEKNIAFLDLGTGTLKVLQETLTDRNIFVIDHHQPELPPEQRAANVEVVNCHDFGMDGGKEACGGSTTYLCFRDTNPELAELGMVAAVGDMQDHNGLAGVNLRVLQESVDAGKIKVSTGLRAFGRVSRPLVGFLSYCTEPLLPGLTGNDKNCASFLADLGIETRDASGKYLALNDLPPKSQQALTSAIIEYAISKGMPEEAVRGSIGNNYTLLGRTPGTPLYDAYEFATLLNACGRNGKPEVGIRVCFGDAEAVREADEILQEHRTQLRRGILLARTKTSDLNSFYFFDGRGIVRDSIIGTVSGAALGSGALPAVKPIIGISDDVEDPTMLKGSGRGTKELVARGLDLNKVLRAATLGLGKSAGGGHNVAAGCSVEKIYLTEFLKRCDVEIRKQLEIKIEN